MHPAQSKYKILVKIYDDYANGLGKPPALTDS